MSSDKVLVLSSSIITAGALTGGVTPLALLGMFMTAYSIYRMVD